MLAGCAHPIMPSGGPKDIEPPAVISSSPENYSTNFSTNRFSVTFDEFFKLKDPRKEIFISPPVKEFPEFKIKGKTLITEFKEPLRQNSTYTIYFGNSIIDITESNPKTGFEYVFSTGPELDSLSMIGNIKDAFNEKPQKEVLVMLYLNENDTIPLDSLPLFVAPLSACKTDESGNFILNNLKDLDYKIFALQDANSNYIYDQPNERIAFSDTLVIPEYLPNLSIKNDTTNTSPDTSSVSVMETMQPKYFYELYLFDETDTLQKLVDRKAIDRSRIFLSFKLPVQELELKLLPPLDTIENWHVKEFDKNRDTLNLWLLPLPSDTLHLLLKEKRIPEDTLSFVFRELPEESKKQKKNVDKSKLTLSTNTRAGFLEFPDDLELLFSKPLKTDSLESIILIENKDTLSLAMTYIDDIQRKTRLSHDWKEKSSYTLIIPENRLTDISGEVNDSIIIKFSTKSREEYGTLYLNMTFESSHRQYIVYILDDKENKIREQVVKEPGTVEFHYLIPRLYTIKAVQDQNRNGQWDTGDYSKKIQPEKVFYFSGQLQVRANWETSEEWSLP